MWNAALAVDATTASTTNAAMRAMSLAMVSPRQ
jgi:hypothetical protein